tara:strand:+ start:444 stop:671 length:228 start_codon:yes stop_codon:yes gene_type:complete
MSEIIFPDGHQASVVMESFVSSWDAIKCVLENSEEIQNAAELRIELEDFMKNISKVDDGIMGMMDAFETFLSKNA